MMVLLAQSLLVSPIGRQLILRLSPASAAALLPSHSSSTEYRTDDDPESCHQKTGQDCTLVDIGDIYSTSSTQT